MQWLARVCVQRPIFASVLMLLLCVIGVFGYVHLGVDRFPKVDFPAVTVITRYNGAAPKEVESEVTDKIEEAVNTISGIDGMQSTSSEGVSQVFITFLLEKDIDVAAQEVRDKINTVLGELPQGADMPTVLALDSGSTPIVYLSVKADRPLREITRVADDVVRARLATVPGVGEVKILGGQERQVNVAVDPLKLRAYGLTSLDVPRALESQNLTLPGGRVEAGPSQPTLRIAARFPGTEEMEDLIVRSVDGHIVRLRDVATVEDGGEVIETAARQDGVPTVVLSVRKQSDANTVAVVDAVKARVGELGAELPAGYSLHISRDGSETIRTSVHAVLEHLIIGALLAALVVLLFLGNLRSTLIAAVAIPISLIGTFAVMYWRGFTLNTITLLALALSVGIVIDDAIVVLENIHRFMEEKKMKPFDAAIHATKEIGLAVLATTLSLVAVFLPVAFMTGMVGRFLESFGLTMAFAILISMLVSFALTPMLSARWLTTTKLQIVDVVYTPIERLYVRMLEWIMRHRWVVVVSCVLSLASVVPLIGAVQKGFLPRNDEAHFLVIVKTPEGSSLPATSIAAERVARRIRALPEVTATLVTIGDDTEKTQNRAEIYVKLVHPQDRELSQHELMDVVRKDAAANASSDLRIAVAEVPMFSAASTATIEYVLSGPDLDVLRRLSEDALARLKGIEGVVDADTSLVFGKPEVQTVIDRERAADLGVNVADVARALRLLVGGLEVSSFEEKGELYEVHVRAESAYRSGVDGIEMLSVPSSRGGSVLLSEVARLETAEGPTQIKRHNRTRQVTITAGMGPGYAEGTAMAKFEEEIAAMKLPAGYELSRIGRSKEMARTMGAFAVAFLMSFLFMYLILAAQFESWLHPVTILLGLPLTLPFALISLILFNQALDIYSMLGLLVLFGVVKKNAILQIDHTNALRREGRSRWDAIIEANRDRLRPILMTTLAFVAGMIPLAFSNGIGAGFNQATAGVVVGGQVLSLLLTLVATPVAYSLFDDAAMWLKSLRPARAAVRAEA